MKHNVRRSTSALVLLIVLALLIAACQRERPSREPGEGWTVSPIQEPTDVSGAAGQASPAPSTTTIAVDASPQAETQAAVATAQPPVAAVTAVPVGTAESTVALPEGPTFSYIVQSGDTLFSIALRYDTDVETLRRLNGLPDDAIGAGQVLLVPGTGDEGQPGSEDEVPEVTYVVKSGDTLSSIASDFGVDWEVIAGANDITGPNFTIFRGQKLTIPGVSPTAVPTDEVTIHVVQSGETLYGIAIQYGLTLQELLIANGISNPDALSVGQELIIPEQ